MIAKESVGYMADLGNECDFAKDVAFLYPLRVMMSVLGVPRADEDLMLRLTQQFFGVADADQARGSVEKTGKEAAEELAVLAGEFNDFFDRLLAERRADPRDDLITVVANALIDGLPMPVLEARSYCQVAATAGHDTTSAALAGGVWALAERPGEFAKVGDDRSIIPSLVQESIRWTSPSKITMRSAARDVDICGRHFRQGDWVGLAWASGNRDEEAFEDPYEFRVDRYPNRLIAFGWGAHNCIGQHLARLEMRILFEEFFARVSGVELAGEPAGLASLQVSGPKRVPIRYSLV
jgi:cytochrome P450